MITDPSPYPNTDPSYFVVEPALVSPRAPGIAPDGPELCYVEDERDWPGTGPFPDRFISCPNGGTDA